MDPRKRLQLAQVSSPSLRVLAAPDAPAVSLGLSQTPAPQLNQAQVASPRSLKLQGQNESQAIYDTSYAYSEPNKPQENLPQRLKNISLAIAKGIISPAQYLANVAILDPARQLMAQVTGNETALRNAEQQANVNLGLGADGKDFASGAKKLLGNSAQALTAPLSLTAGIGKNIALGAVQGAGSGLAQDNSTIKDVALGGAIGGGLGGAGAAIAKITTKTGLPQEAVESVLKSGDKKSIKALTEGSGLSKEEIAQLSAKNVPNPGQIVNPTPTPSSTNLSEVIKANSSNVGAQFPEQIQKAFTETGIQDPYNLLVNALAKESKKSTVRQMVEGLVGNTDSTTLNRLTKKLTEAKTAREVQDIIDAETKAASTLGVANPVQKVDTVPNETLPSPQTPKPVQQAPVEVPNQQPTPPSSNVSASAPVSEGVKSSLKDVLSHVNTEATKARAETKVLYRNARAQRAAAFEEALANGEGEDAWKAAMATMKGPLPKGSYTPLPITEAGRKQIDDFVKSLPGAYNKINLNNALRRVFGEDQGIPTPSDIRYIREAFGDAFADQVNDHVAASKGWKDVVARIISTPKAALATGDLSAPGRQGSVLGARFPKEWGAATSDMTRYAFSNKAFQDGMREITDRPTYELMEKAKLAVDGARALRGSEEEFPPSLLEAAWLKKIGVGQLAAGSDRAYTGFLTKFRADVFDEMVTRFQKTGVELDDKQLKAIGTFINTATGRGDLGSLERYAGALGQAFFSPRLWKSRIDLINPVYYKNLTPEVRKYALQSTGNFLSAATAVLGLAAAAGASVSWDPRSSDFMKIKVGNTRFDILSGLQQNIVLFYRLATGQKVNSETGQVATLGPDKGFGKPDRLDLLIDFFQNKANPSVGLVAKGLTGTAPDGQPYNMATETAKSLIPLNFQAVYETAKDSGSLSDPKNLAKAAAITAPSFVGVGVNTYGQTATKDKEAQPTDIAGSIKQAKDDKAKTKADFEAGLTEDQKTLIKQSEASLKKLRDEGAIDESTYRTTVALKKAQSNLVDGVKQKKGLTSDDAKSFYQKYNTLTEDGQKSFLERSSKEADNIAKAINKDRPVGYPELPASNKLAKLYADFEADINKDITAVEKNNKIKSFYASALKMQYTNVAQKLYAEGGSTDTKGLLGEGTVSKDDLDKAIDLDNALYNAGITTSLKFAKKFRKEYGYGLPEGNERAGTKGPQTQTNGTKTKTEKGYLSNLLSDVKVSGAKLPRFVPKNSKVTLKMPNLPATSAKPKVSINL